MKTLVRILIILAAFTIVMGVTYGVVNAGSASTSANMPPFERGGEGGSRPEGMQPPFSNGEMPEFPDGGRPEFDDENLGGSWMFGFVKNISILAIIVALITVLRKLMQRNVTPVPAA